MLKPFATRESFYRILQTLLPGFFFFCADYPPTDEGTADRAEWLSSAAAKCY